MVALSMYLKQPNFIYLCTYLWLATLAVANAGTGITAFFTGQSKTKTQEPIEVAALGRPLSLGMLYNCREDSFIPGVTLWDENSLRKNVYSRSQPMTDLKFSSSDSLSSKSRILDVSASLKVSFLGGLVNVDGSGKFLHDTKSSHRQSRVTMYYSETTKYEQLTMSQLGQFNYPQVFDQKSATHVVTAVLYGAQAVMVFDRTVSEEENKQEIEGKLNGVVRSIVGLSIEGDGSVNMNDDDKKIAKNTICTFYGDFLLERNPTTYMEAIQTYKTLPTLIKNNQTNVVPIKVWLHPLHLLDNKAAKLEREINIRLISNIEGITDVLEEAERTYNDLIKSALVNVFSDIKGRLDLFKDSFNTYKSMLLKAVGRVLPDVRGGDKEEMLLEEILKIHRSSPFNDGMLNKWLDDAKSELHTLSSYINALQATSSITKSAEEIKIVDSVGLITTLSDPDVDAVVSLTFTSLKYEDPYLSTVKEFLELDKFKELDERKYVTKWLSEHIGDYTWFSEEPDTKWFNDPNVRRNIRENVSQFKRFAEVNKGEKRIRFIISVISNPSIAGSSIYLYEKGQLTDTQFQPLSKPPPPIVKNVLAKGMSLKLQKSSTGETVQYRLECKQADSRAEQPWLSLETVNKEFILTGLVSGKHYLIRYRTVGKVGVSEVSDTVNTSPLAEPVIVGGTGGGEFSFTSTLGNTFYKIVVFYYEEDYSFTSSVKALTTIEVGFRDSQIIRAGRNEGNKKKEFIFDKTDTIVTATLWPNKNNDRFGGLEFEVENSNGERKTMSLKCSEVGKPVNFNVGSGRLYGIKGRSGDELDALGFYFN